MKISRPPLVGLGDEKGLIRVFTANRPPLKEYKTLANIRPIALAEVDCISKATGNHWRKVFNVYAKLIFELGLSTNQFTTWQAYRDGELLQRNSNTALLFSKIFKEDLPYLDKKAINIIMGKTYAGQLGFCDSNTLGIQWLDNYFAIAHEFNLVVCPYFDYRQLSNRRITQLCRVLREYELLPQ